MADLHKLVEGSIGALVEGFFSGSDLCPLEFSLDTVRAVCLAFFSRETHISWRINLHEMEI